MNSNETPSEIKENLRRINETLWKFEENLGTHSEITEDQRHCMNICRTSLKINASQKTYLEILQTSMAHRRKSTGNPRTFREAIEFSTCCYVCNDCGDNQHGDC